MSVSAHPGKTDSNGGHTDHSTGEYHYHHGYPAHQHDDVNGDGIPDCPYEFKDITGEQSGNHSITVKSTTDTVTAKSTTDTVRKTSSASTQGNQNNMVGNSFGTMIVLSFVVLIGIIVIQFVSIRSNKKEKKRLTEDLQKSQEQIMFYAGIESEYKCQIAKLISDHKREKDYLNLLLNDQKRENSKLNQMYQNSKKPIKESLKSVDLLEYCGASKGTYIGTDNKPHRLNVNGLDDYVVYISTDVYHKRNCRYAKVNCGIHVLDLPERSHPCYVCYPAPPDTKWYSNYLAIKEFIESI